MSGVRAAANERMLVLPPRKLRLPSLSKKKPPASKPRKRSHCTVHVWAVVTALPVEGGAPYYASTVCFATSDWVSKEAKKNWVSTS